MEGADDNMNDVIYIGLFLLPRVYASQSHLTKAERKPVKGKHN